MNSRRIRKCDKQKGSAIIVTMILTFVISIMVATAIRYVVNEHAWSVHSANWAQALHTAEAGIEVALAALEQSVSGTYEWSSSGCGWTEESGNVWKRALADLAPDDHCYPNSSYSVSLDTSDINAYVVTATGQMPEPRTGNTLTRTVQVTLTPDYFRKFERGMLGDEVDFQGNPDCDSYNSEDGPYGGFNVSTNCSIASVSEDPDGIHGGGSPVVKGDVFVTETGDATGDFWTGEEHNDFEADIPPYVPDRTDTPDGAWTGGEVVNVPADSGADGYIGLTHIDPSGADKTVTIQGEGTVTIYVDDYVDFGTSTDFNIVPDAGKQLTVIIEVDGPLSLFGTLNDTGNPIDLQIYGTDNCTSMDVAANNDKMLCVYAPNAEIKLTGNAAIYGSIVGKEIRCQGNFDFHYDESLATNGTPTLQGFSIASWQEL